jgi:hypothetical protein
MLLMEKFRAWLKEERPPPNFRNETGRSLRVLQNIVVVGEGVDVREPGTLSQQITNTNSLRSFNSWNEIAVCSSRLIEPASASRKTAAAVNCIETEAMWNLVLGVFRIRRSRSACHTPFRKRSCHRSQRERRWRSCRFRRRAERTHQ